MLSPKLGFARVGSSSRYTSLGYLLSIVTEALIHHQAGTSQPDPIHLAAHFLRPSLFDQDYELHVNIVKRGSQFTNILAEFIQKVSPSLPLSIRTRTEADGYQSRRAK